MHKAPSHDMQACFVINYTLLHIIFIVRLSSNFGFILIFLIMTFLVIIKSSSMYGTFIWVCAKTSLSVSIIEGTPIFMSLSVLTLHNTEIRISECLRIHTNLHVATFNTPKPQKKKQYIYILLLWPSNFMHFEVV